MICLCNVKSVMTKAPLVTAKEGTTLEEATKILQQHKIEKLPIVDDDNTLKGLITIKDIEKKEQYPDAIKIDLEDLELVGQLE